MAFWGELYRRKKDEDDIWEELRQMLINAPSQNDILQQKRQEQAEVDALVERMFPDIPQPKKEPYLTQEELFGVQNKQSGQPTGMVSSVLNGNAISERHIDPILEEINSKVDWSDELKAQKMAEVSKIQENALAREKEINREHLIGQAKNYGGVALSNVLPALIPSSIVVGAGAKMAPIVRKVLPQIGNKIKNQISNDIVRSSIASPINTSVQNWDNKSDIPRNIIKNLPSDIAQGVLLGGYQARLDKNNATKIINKNVEKWNTRQQRKQDDMSLQYYNDYVKDTKSAKSYDEWLEELKRKRKR